MATGKRYYWIKLKDTFMTSDAVDFLMGQKDGANYVVLYQMLCLKTINTGGRLERTIGEVIIPYDEEKIQRDTKWFSIDTVRVALNLYKSLGLIYADENGVLCLTDHDSLVGSETNWAIQKRNQRCELQEGGQCPPNVHQNVHTDIRDKDIRDKDTRYKEIRDKEINNTPPKSPSRGNEGELLEEAFGYNQYLLDAVKDWLAYKKEKRQGYGERALKSLLTQLKNRVSEYGEDAVIEVIQESMAANYQGITWDKLKNQNRQQKPGGGYSFMDILKQEEKNESYRNS